VTSPYNDSMVSLYNIVYSGYRLVGICLGIPGVYFEINCSRCSAVSHRDNIQRSICREETRKYFNGDMKFRGQTPSIFDMILLTPELVLLGGWGETILARQDWLA